MTSTNPVPPPEADEGRRWAQDGNATREERAFPDEDILTGQRRENELKWLRVYGWLVVGLMVVLTLIFVASIVSWTWHYLTPEGWHWLTADQLLRIQSVIFSGSLGAIASAIAQRQLQRQ